jgi:hypothetical protein
MGARRKVGRTRAAAYNLADSLLEEQRKLSSGSEYQSQGSPEAIWESANRDLDHIHKGLTEALHYARERKLTVEIEIERIESALCRINPPLPQEERTSSLRGWNVGRSQL